MVAGSVLTVAAVVMALPERADRTPVGVILVELPRPASAPPTEEPDAPAAPVPPSGAGPAAPEAWAPDVVELVRFIERERELTFARPVTVELLSDEDYVADLGGSDDGSLGYYDGRRVVGRGTELTPALQGTLVHELTHALDDQHFDIFALDVGAEVSGEEWLAYQGLVEGDAIRMERAYDEMQIDRGVDPEDVTDTPAAPAGLATTPANPVAVAASAAEASWRQPHGSDRYGSDLASLDQALDEWPYYVGEQFLDALVSEGGNAAVDAAFRDPPRTTEQVLDPRAYLERDEPVAVAPPQPTGVPGDEVRTQASVGALNLYLVLAAGIDPLRALDAVTGWGGESAVAYDDDAGRGCVDVAVVGDTEADTAEIGEAFAAWADSGVAGRTATARRDDGAHVLTACDLRTSGGPAGVDPFEALALAGVPAASDR